MRHGNQENMTEKCSDQFCRIPLFDTDNAMRKHGAVGVTALRSLRVKSTEHFELVCFIFVSLIIDALFLPWSCVCLPV